MSYGTWAGDRRAMGDEPDDRMVSGLLTAGDELAEAAEAILTRRASTGQFPDARSGMWGRLHNAARTWRARSGRRST